MLSGSSRGGLLPPRAMPRRSGVHASSSGVAPCPMRRGATGLCGALPRREPTPRRASSVRGQRHSVDVDNVRPSSSRMPSTGQQEQEEEQQLEQDAGARARGAAPSSVGEPAASLVQSPQGGGASLFGVSCVELVAMVERAFSSEVVDTVDVGWWSQQLGVRLSDGLDPSDATDRQARIATFGSNRLPPPRLVSLFELVLEAFQVGGLGWLGWLSLCDVEMHGRGRGHLFRREPTRQSAVMALGGHVEREIRCPPIHEEGRFMRRGETVAGGTPAA
eukprot:365530-Chlamydomonas_euryale.AAC.6